MFANLMTTAAVIDRNQHHSVITEFDLPNYRTNAAQNRQMEKVSDRQHLLTRPTKILTGNTEQP